MEVNGEVGVARILIVEDDASLRSLFEVLLEDMGHEVSTAETGELGLSLAEKSHFDLAICDVVLPGIDGIEVVKRLRQLQPEIKVVGVSAGSDRLPAAIALNMTAMFGAQEILYKPFRNAELIAAVKRLLG